MTVLPTISAPIDEGVLLPRPPRGLWHRLMWICIVAALAAVLLSFAFLHATLTG